MSEEQTELLKRIADELSRLRAMQESERGHRTRVDHEKGKVIVTYIVGEPGGIFSPKPLERDMEFDL